VEAKYKELVLTKNNTIILDDAVTTYDGWRYVN
jgi:phosphoribosylaminoimidazole-succinocarboxamide synthase